VAFARELVLSMAVVAEFSSSAAHMLISAAPALRSVASPSRASSCLLGWMQDSDSLAVGPSSASE